MDLLESILGSMEKPPNTSDKQKKKSKQIQDIFHKKQEEERKKKVAFRGKVEKDIEKFTVSSEKELEYPPMENVWRAIIHDVAEVAGLVSHSFGEEGVDKHTVIFKMPPSEEEIIARKKGLEYDPEGSVDQSDERGEGSEPAKSQKLKSKEKFVPATVDYHAKYKHILGSETGIEAARKAEPNQKFGMVPSDRKRDVRSIEETMNQLRSKKKRELSEEES